MLSQGDQATSDSFQVQIELLIKHYGTANVSLLPKPHCLVRSTQVGSHSTITTSCQMMCRCMRQLFCSIPAIEKRTWTKSGRKVGSSPVSKERRSFSRLVIDDLLQSHSSLTQQSGTKSERRGIFIALDCRSRSRLRAKTSSPLS
jgi:hypothetical protein